MGNKYILCLEVNEETTKFIQENLPGSLEIECGGCGTPLWLASSSREIMRDGDVIPLCERCLDKQSRNEEIAVVITERQMLQVKTWLEKN